MKKELTEAQKIHKKEYQKQWRLINKEKKNEYEKQRRKIYSEDFKKIRKKSYEKNKDKNKEYGQKYYKENKKPLTIEQKENNKNYKKSTKYKEYKKLYRKLNRDKINKQDKIRRENDPLYKLYIYSRNRINSSMKMGFFTKKSHTQDVIGCSFEEFKKHLESKFEFWMNWDNHGSINKKRPTNINQCWDIDHIIPLSTTKTENELIKLLHYSNIQPLCSYTNRWIKSDNVYF